MISAVLDTNTLVSGLGWAGSTPAQVVDAALQGRFLLVTSPALLAELDRVLRYPRLAPVFADPDRLLALLAGARRTSGDVEVALLGAASRDALERTHGRYFRTPRELSAGI